MKQRIGVIAATIGLFHVAPVLAADNSAGKGNEAEFASEAVPMSELELSSQPSAPVAPKPEDGLVVKALQFIADSGEHIIHKAAHEKTEEPAAVQQASLTPKVISEPKISLENIVGDSHEPAPEPKLSLETIVADSHEAKKPQAVKVKEPQPVHLAAAGSFSSAMQAAPSQPVMMPRYFQESPYSLRRLLYSNPPIENGVDFSSAPSQ